MKLNSKSIPHSQALRALAFFAGSLVLAALAGATYTHAGDIQIKIIEESVPADDHLVAILSYELTESSTACGGGVTKGQTESLRVVVHADGRYHGTEIRSRISCRSRGEIGRASSQTKHNGRLTPERLARLLSRLESLGGPSRDLARAEEYRTTLQVSPDARGVLSERDLPSTRLTGEAGRVSAQFMQRFLVTGKID